MNAQGNLSPSGVEGATGGGTPAFTFDALQAFSLYVTRQFDALSEKFIGMLAHFEQANYLTLSTHDMHQLNSFLRCFLCLFTQPDYLISDTYIGPFLRLNLTISNVVAVSSFQTTDPYLAILRGQQANFIKTMVLWSARNSVKFDRKKFFDVDPVAASIWYSTYCQIYRSGLLKETVVANLVEHYAFVDERLDLVFEPQEAFFGSTYVDGRCDRLIKPIINRSAARSNGQYSIRNRPNPRKVAILSALWARSHSVYRITSQYVELLRGAYHLTFFQLGGSELVVDRSMFDETRHIATRDGKLDITALQDNDFQVAYFPDVGMSPQSIILANLRTRADTDRLPRAFGQHLGFRGRLFH